MFKRLKNVENALKNKINNKDNEHKDQKQQQNNNIDTKPPNVFDYLKSLIQEAKDLMDEIDNVDDDTDNNKLLFIDSSKEKFNFNIFRMQLNFLSAIYNGEISLKRQKFI